MRTTARPRTPGERLVVGVADRDDAARSTRASHLAKRGNRLREVLEHLVRMNDVEVRSPALSV